jgi:phage/plasmid primase-like uncharacterized protein
LVQPGQNFHGFVERLTLVAESDSTVLSPDGFRNWQNGGWQDWCAKDARTLTPQERAQFQRKIGQARRHHEEEARCRQVDARNRARREWESAGPAPADHAYLALKGIKAHGLRLYTGNLIISGTECDGALLVPLRDSNGDLHSLEFITYIGTKLPAQWSNFGLLFRDWPT